MNVPADAAFVVTHKTGDWTTSTGDGCGQIACYLTRRVVDGDILGAGLVIWPDGRRAVNDDGTGDGDLVVCGSCGRGIGQKDFMEAEPI